MLKTGKLGLGALLLLALLVGSCGYYNPHVYSGPARVVYMPNWQNRTNKLGLDNRIYLSIHNPCDSKARVYTSFCGY